MILNDITLKDILHAKKRITTRIKNTPFVFSRPLYDTIGKNVWLKLENLQETGSFKLRGAANAILSCWRRCENVIKFLV